MVVAARVDQQVGLSSGASLLPAANGQRVAVPVPCEAIYHDVVRTEGEPKLAVLEAVLLEKHDLFERRANESSDGMFLCTGFRFSHQMLVGQPLSGGEEGSPRRPPCKALLQPVGPLRRREEVALAPEDADPSHPHNLATLRWDGRHVRHGEHLRSIQWNDHARRMNCEAN